MHKFDGFGILARQILKNAKISSLWVHLLFSTDNTWKKWYPPIFEILTIFTPVYPYPYYYGCLRFYKGHFLHNLRYLLKKQSFLKNLKSQKLFQILKKVIMKMFKATNQFLFFQFFLKCLNVLCVIVCMNISWKTISFIIKINLVFEEITQLSMQYYSLHTILPSKLFVVPRRGLYLDHYFS